MRRYFLFNFFFIFNTHFRYPLLFYTYLCDSYVLITILVYVSFFHFGFHGLGAFPQKQSAVLLVSYLHGWVGGRGTFCFRDGVFLSLSFMYWEKLSGSFLHWEYFWSCSLVFIFFLLFLSFWKSYLHTRGSLNLLACFETLGFIIYWLVLGEGD